MSVIIINYRRGDSAAYAGRLYDRLASHFGRALYSWILITLHRQSILLMSYKKN
jgi:hypothetical protein